MWGALLVLLFIIAIVLIVVDHCGNKGKIRLKCRRIWLKRKKKSCNSSSSYSDSTSSTDDDDQ